MDAAAYRAKYYRLALPSDCLELLAVLLAGVIGVVYIRTEYSTATPNAGWAFILILEAATCLLLFAEHYMRRFLLRQGLGFFRYLYPNLGQGEVIGLHWTTLHRVHRSDLRIFFGVSYGALLSLAPYILNTWPNDIRLQTLLAAFLFLVNYITGNVLYSLAIYLWKLGALSERLKIDVWNSQNPSTAFYVRSILTIFVFGCAYVSTSMSSILFSPFDREPILYLYACVCFLMLITTFAYPYLRLVWRISDSKREVCGQISARLEKLLAQALSTEVRTEADDLLREIQQLTQLRNVVAALDDLPFRRASVLVLGTATFLLTHPFVLEVALSMKLLSEP